MKKGRYLITGSAGFIGSNLVKRIYKDFDLILVDDLSEGSIKNLPRSIKKKLIKRKIQDIKSLKLKRLDGIFHLAAQSSVPLSLKDSYNSSSNNINSTLKIFDISKKFSAPIVYASSSAIYGNLPKGDDKIEKFLIQSPYAQDKLTMEHYAKMMFNIFKISSVGLRLFNVYGPGQRFDSPYSAVIPIFIESMKKNRTIIINGGYQTRDFIYVDDVVNIILDSMNKIQKQKNFKVLNVGTGNSISINHLFKLIKKILSANPRVIKRKLDTFDPKKSSGTFNKIRNFLGYKNNNFTTLKQGLVKTIYSTK